MNYEFQVPINKGLFVDEPTIKGSIIQKTLAAPTSPTGTNSSMANLGTTGPTSTITEGTIEDTDARTEWQL